MRTPDMAPPTGKPPRELIEAAIENLITMLDQMDGDADLEPDVGDEPQDDEGAWNAPFL